MLSGGGPVRRGSRLYIVLRSVVTSDTHLPFWVCPVAEWRRACHLAGVYFFIHSLRDWVGSKLILSPPTQPIVDPKQVQLQLS